ncbi:MAG TPA: hypothetical protein VFN37_07480 [Candidatus Baltobacteraceae bacterium]|nr:hypothetical protein [Candidatus Baltobacteraceae bacterium]
MRSAIAVLLFALTLVPAAARADDSGPSGTVARLRSEARRLVAREARASGVDPKDAIISDVAVNGNQATLSWEAGKTRRVMRLTFRNDRWWDMPDPSHGAAASVWQIDPQGGAIAPPREITAGYGLRFVFTANDAPAPVNLTQIYARPPTAAEFLPNHPLAPGWGSSDAVCYFDITVGGSKNVTFKPGTALDVWFPFVLDDQLDYSVSFVSNDKPYEMTHAAIFDNTLHFVLGEFTLAPGKPLMAEIDGDPKPAR